MKIKENFLLKNIAGSYVVVPTGSELVDFNGMVTLNESGAFLWNLLKQEQTAQSLATAMTEEYDVTAETAARDVEKFLDTLKKAELLEQ